MPRRAEDPGHSRGPVGRVGSAERGSAAIVVPAIGAILVLAAGLLGDLGALVAAKAVAATAADAAALAAAAEQSAPAGGDPREAARLYAEANGARLENCECGPSADSVIVVVSVKVRFRFVIPREALVRKSARAGFASLGTGVQGSRPLYHDS